MGTNYQGTEAEVLALNTFIKLVRAAETVAARVEAHLTRRNLSVSQFGVLETLLHLGPLYQKELAQKTLKSGGNITLVVDNLEKRRLVKRVRDEQDRRHYAVTLTAEGRRLIKAIFPAHTAGIVAEFGILGKNEQKELGRLCKIVGLQKRESVRK